MFINNYNLLSNAMKILKGKRLREKCTRCIRTEKGFCSHIQKTCIMRFVVL